MKSIHRFALCAQICIAASFVTAGSASAASTLNSVSVAALSKTSTAQLLSTGTQVFAWDINTTVASTSIDSGRITFSNAQPGTVALSASPATWQATSSNAPYASYTDVGMQEVLSDFLFTQGNTNATVTLNGLAANQQYRVQFLHIQEGVNASARQNQIYFGTSAATGTTGLFAPGLSGGVNTAYISTFEFTTDNTVNGSQVFTFTQAGGSNADDRSLLNAATLFAVPEPSAALLGGLGMLALLRRRRN